MSTLEFADYSLSKLILSPDDQQLFRVVINYLRLSEFDMARKTVNDLFATAPLRLIRILRSIFSRYYPTDWYVLKLLWNVKY